MVIILLNSCKPFKSLESIMYVIYLILQQKFWFHIETSITLIRFKL
jgi:hypothetical protein